MANGWLSYGDPEVVLQWERGIDIEARLRLALMDEEYGFASSSEDSVVVLKDGLATNAGGSIRSYFAYQLDSPGRAKDEQLENFEDRHRTSTFDIKVDVLRNAVAVDTPMYQQMVQYDTLETSKKLLGDWFAQRIEFGLHAHAAGLSIITKDAFNLNNTITALQSTHIYRPNGKAAGALTSGDILTVDVFNDVQMLLNLLRPKIRPASTPFGPKYVMFISPEQARDLRKSDSVWFQIMQSAIQGGQINDNPIFNNMLGAVHDILLYVSDMTPPGLNSGGTKIKSKTRRAWIAGAGALSLAFGRGWAPPPFAMNRYQWDSNSQDYGHRKTIAASTIIGAARPYFTDPKTSTVHEQGVIAVETYADYPTQLTDSLVYKQWIDAGCSVEA